MTGVNEDPKDYIIFAGLIFHASKALSVGLERESASFLLFTLFLISCLPFYKPSEICKIIASIIASIYEYQQLVAFVIYNQSFRIEFLSNLEQNGRKSDFSRNFQHPFLSE